MRTKHRENSTVVLAGACVLLLTVATSATATELYSGVRMYDGGPFTVWQGVDDDDPSQNVFAVRGGTKGFRVSYSSAGQSPSIAYYSDRIELRFYGSGGSELGVQKLLPTGPWQDWIIYCTNIGVPGGRIWCDCQQQPDNICDKFGIVGLQPNQGWLDM